jgi:hypothetical protein
MHGSSRRATVTRHDRAEQDVSGKNVMIAVLNSKIRARHGVQMTSSRLQSVSELPYVLMYGPYGRDVAGVARLGSSGDAKE